MDLKNKKLWIIICAIILLISVLLVGYFCFWRTYQKAGSIIDRGDIEIWQQEDGKLILTWPKSKQKDRYLLQIYKENQKAEKIYLVNEYLNEEQYVLPALPDDEFLTICIYTAVDYKQLWLSKERLCDIPLSVTTKIISPKIENLSWTADVNKKIISVSFDAINTTLNKLYLQTNDSSWDEVLCIDKNSFDLGNVKF